MSISASIAPRRIRRCIAEHGVHQYQSPSLASTRRGLAQTVLVVTRPRNGFATGPEARRVDTWLTLRESEPDWGNDRSRLGGYDLIPGPTDV